MVVCVGLAHPADVLPVAGPEDGAGVGGNGKAEGEEVHAAGGKEVGPAEEEIMFF